MNYFELFEIPQAFAIDVVAIDKKYLELQRKFHPDRFIGKPENERIEAAQKSADVNEGYRILKDSLLRAQYLLKLNGIMVGCEAEDNEKASSELLEEMMELGERMQSSEAYKHEMEKTISTISELFAKGDIKGAAQCYFRAKFLWRLMDNAKKGVSHAA